MPTCRRLDLSKNSFDSTTMDLKELCTAVDELRMTKSPEEAQLVLSRHPDLLKEENILTLRNLAAAARAKGELEGATLLEQVATFLATTLPPSVDATVGSNREQNVPVSSGPLIPWARLIRRYLAHRQTDDLFRAIAAARDAGEQSVVAHLEAFSSRDVPTIDATGDVLLREFECKGRQEEFSTVVLLCLHWRADLAQEFQDYAPDQQAQILEAGLGFCEHAAKFAKALQDQACEAAYKSMAALGYARSGHPAQAAALAQEALLLHQALALEEPGVFLPYVATTLNILGTQLRDLGRFAEAEQIHRAALKLRRELAQTNPQTYSEDVAGTLQNLAVVMHDTGRLEEAEKALRESLALRLNLPSEQQPDSQSQVAATLGNLGVGLTAMRRLDEAENVTQQALAIYRVLAEQQPERYRLRVLSTLINLGEVFFRLRRIEEAESTFREAAESYRQMPQPQTLLIQAGLALALNNHGNALRLLDRLEEAEADLREAVDLRRELARVQPQVHDSDLAMSLNNLAGMLNSVWHLPEAESTAQEALALYRQLAQSQPEAYAAEIAGTLHTLGSVLDNMRRLTEAEAAYRDSLEIHRGVRQSFAISEASAMTMSNLGIVLRKLRRLEEARDVCAEVTAWYRQLSPQHLEIYKPSLATALNNFGNVLWEMRQLDKAKSVYEESLALYRELAEQDSRAFEASLALILSNLGLVEHDLRHLVEAEDLIQEGIVLYRKLAQQYPQAFETSVAMTLANLGIVLKERQKPAQAADTYQEALEIYRRHDVPDERVKVLAAIGLLKMEAEDWTAAADVFREATEQTEQLRTEAQSLDGRAQILGEFVNIYENYLICLMKLGRHEQALEVAEQGKSRTLVDLLALRDLRPRNAPPHLSQEYERMLFKAQALDDQLQQQGLADAPMALSSEQINAQQQDVERLRRKRVDTTSRLNALVKEIRLHDPDFLSHAVTLNAAQIKTLSSNAGATLLLCRVTPAGSYIFLVFPGGEIDVVTVSSFTSDVLGRLILRPEDGSMAGWVGDYYAYLSASEALGHARQTAEQTLQPSDVEIARQAERWAIKCQAAWHSGLDNTLGQLYDGLIEFAHQRLRDRRDAMGDSKRLVIVPNRGLAIMPLQACWWNEGGRRHYLMDEYVISYAPSLSVFDRCVQREREGRDRETMLLISDPSANLSFSEWECREIETIFGPEQCLLLLHEEATKAEILRLSAQQNWLHFSCHGQYRLDAPFESSLQLANGEELTLGEILEQFSLKQTWLTVLSACETGLVDFREIADEHYGLPLGFILAGVPTVWGTLWAVSDQSTALLMKKAYENLLVNGNGKAEALRAAQIWLRNASVEDLAQMIPSERSIMPSVARQSEADRDLDQNLHEHPFAHPYYWAGMQCVGV